MFERFSDQARRVVVLAKEEARMLGHDSIGTEHVLLGLMREGDGVAAQALESLGLDLAAVRQQVGEIVGQGKQGQGTQGHIPFTARAKKVLELSLREALQLGDDHIGTEHVLLGLLRLGDGTAAQVLVSLGTDLNRVRAEVIALKAAIQPAEVIATSHVEMRLSAIEQRVGLAPATADLDQQILQARIDRNAAVAAGDHERAAAERERERELVAIRVSRLHQWVAAEHPDPPSLAELAEKVRQLSEEVEQLRGLLRRHDLEPGAGTA